MENEPNSEQSAVNPQKEPNMTLDQQQVNVTELQRLNEAILLTMDAIRRVAPHLTQAQQIPLPGLQIDPITAAYHQQQALRVMAMQPWMVPWTQTWTQPFAHATPYTQPFGGSPFSHAWGQSPFGVPASYAQQTFGGVNGFGVSGFAGGQPQPIATPWQTPVSFGSPFVAQRPY
jgi:hypothetical protein